MADDADAPRPTRAHGVAVVVPGGLGATFKDLLDGGADGAVLAGSSHGGEAGVDFVLLPDGPRVTEMALGTGGPPVIAVMALLTCCASDELPALGEALEHSDRWDGALAIWRRCGGKTEAPRAFRATALREDGLERPPKTNEIARAAGAGVWRRWGWRVSMTAWDIEVIAVWTGSFALCGLPLTAGWVASKEPLRFWPAEYAAGERGGTELRPSVCCGLLHAAAISPDQIVIDPMAGGGALPAAAVRLGGCRYALAGDVRRECAHQCKARRDGRGGRDGRAAAGASRMEVARWDVRRLPLRAGCIDAVIMDFPWGNRHKASHALLAEAVGECGRVLRAGGTLLILLPRSEAARLARLDTGLAPLRTMPLVVGGFPRLGALTVSELLVRVWPALIPTQSVAKRTVRHGLVCVASRPKAPLNWRERVAVGERVVVRPLGAQRVVSVEDAAALGAVPVLWESDTWLCGVHSVPI
ncbi:hypothetical protein EMIHUDRAFT_246701 [Emiliania huxleyi CCMP1516]|uniref:Ribosomal RNA large subunit methyltransferase K/L-like methyltransferase domain-containing protein n=3 Tax=Emiliania huxleyi TaxID=2903 RepID=A0A0D3IQZ3_EMIH1|nr:hypothetical protein EMIHUDRAFT_246701 [Emiliania huxleyi CCMP1516]EOD13678.1 hypothetical protein EMIHUDRAFT_246701 [Emiliania huxleyi CCMP1516]|eukprot:XP_005766107.1 hypothetical protein EMIHUDRAFT_246701 [Emiliania huxleyi CCMP1516]